MKMFKAETGQYIEVDGQDGAGVTRHKARGFSVVEMLVDTTLGREVPISVEGQTQGGVGRLLVKKRLDEGHKGQPAFMLPSQWASLSSAERESYKPIPPDEDHTLQPRTAHVEALAVATAQNAALMQRIADLEARMGGKSGK